MYDIAADKDLIIDATTEDLVIEDTPNNLVRRAVITPLGYLTWEYDANKYVDQAYGNSIYTKIGENVNSSLLADMNSDVDNALKFVDVVVKEIQTVVDSLNQVTYIITYANNQTQEILINV
jgi:hypothetical protein